MCVKAHVKYFQLKQRLVKPSWFTIGRQKKNLCMFYEFRSSPRPAVLPPDMYTRNNIRPGPRQTETHSYRKYKPKVCFCLTWSSSFVVFVIFPELSSVSGKVAFTNVITVPVIPKSLGAVSWFLQDKRDVWSAERMRWYQTPTHTLSVMHTTQQHTV